MKRSIQRLRSSTKLAFELDGINKRKSSCLRCRCNRRSGQRASALVKYGAETCKVQGGATLGEHCAAPAFQQLRVAEINAFGHLHSILSVLPHLSYSKYGSTDPMVRDGDALRLSYSDGVFDLVLSPETLEHVPDAPKDIAEMYRVLKPGGTLICTVSLIMNRKTLVRALVHDGELMHMPPASFHGDQVAKNSDHLAFYEFGGDFLGMLASPIFDVKTTQNTRNLFMTYCICRKLQDGGLPSERHRKVTFRARQRSLGWQATASQEHN